MGFCLTDQDIENGLNAAQIVQGIDDPEALRGLFAGLAMLYYRRDPESARDAIEQIGEIIRDRAWSVLQKGGE